MKVIYPLSIIVFFLFASCSAGHDKPIIIHSSGYNLASAKDATPVMLKMIEDAKKANISRIVIEKGTYHFYPEKAFEKYCFITNHDDGLRATPFPLINMKNLEIVADSAEFIFHGLMVPFILEDSENIRLSGFSIDWELPLHSEVEVVAVDKKTRTFDVKVDCPYEIRNGELLFLKEGYEHNLARSICWDPKTGAVAYNTVKVTPLLVRGKSSVVRFTDGIDYLYEKDPNMPEERFRGLETSIFAEEIQPGIVRLSGHHRELPEPGWIIVAKGENSMNRLAPAIRIHGCKDVVVSNVTVHHAGGMGLVCERTENIRLEKFNVALKPGSGRMLTTTADATHFNNCRGLVEMTGCLFENMLDDATNVHGSYARIIDIIDDHTLGIRLGHFQQLGYEFAGPGDKLGFVREGGSFDPYETAKVGRVEKVNKRYYLLEMDELPEDLQKGDLLENLDWYPRLTIRDCIVRNNRARGFIFATPHPVICEGNRMSSMMSAILIHSSWANYWYESGIAQDVIIRNNHFGDNGYGGAGHALIGGHVDKSTDDYPLGTIRIEDNHFRTFDPYILKVSGLDTLVFRNNIVELSENYPTLNPGKPVLELGPIHYRDIEGNTLPENYFILDTE